MKLLELLERDEMKPSYQDVRKLATKYISNRFGLNPPTLEELNVAIDEFLENEI